MVLIDKQSRVPAYEQIRNQLLTLILIGSFAPHSQLPSIRSIAADAGVNINTVKKAFSDLESYGAIYTVPGKGSFVSEKAFKSDTVHDTAVSEISDAISAARPGARRENVENYIRRLQKLEELTGSYPGVEKAYAIQAGREVRIMVKPEVVTEDNMILLARDVAKKIESELEYPGQIKVNVIRETKAVEYAK